MMNTLFKTTLLPIALLAISLTTFADTDVEKKTDTKIVASTSAEQKIFNKADQLWADKKIEKAITEYKKIITKHPNNKLAYQRLASIYLLNNRAKDAIPAYQAAIMHDPENPKLFASMSIAYLHLGQYSMAKAMANEAVALDPNMENAKKIISYTEKKVEVLEQAAKADKEKMPAHDADFLKREMAKHKKTESVDK